MSEPEELRLGYLEINPHVAGLLGRLSIDSIEYALAQIIENEKDQAEPMLLSAMLLASRACLDCNDCELLGKQWGEADRLILHAYPSPNREIVKQAVVRLFSKNMDELAGGIAASAVMDCDRASSKQVCYRRLERADTRLWRVMNTSSVSNECMDILGRWRDLLSKEMKKYPAF